MSKKYKQKPEPTGEPKRLPVKEHANECNQPKIS